MSDTPETDAYVAKLAHDWVLDFGAFDLLLAHARSLERERDEARVQYRTTEALAMALVKTIDELKTEKAELVVKLVNLEGRSRRATLDEISESVREKYDERYEAEEIEN